MQVKFWAKTTVDEQPGISVFEHMKNVGHVACGLACVAPGLLRRFQMRAAEVGTLAALHDLGKISPGFQQKCRAWLKANQLTEVARRWSWDSTMEADHGKVTHAAVQEVLLGNGTSRRAAKFLSAVLGGHHGRLNRPQDRIFRPENAIAEQHSGIDWDKERNQAALKICDTFSVDLKTLLLDDQSPALWWMAGLTSVADWIGSDENFFSPEQGANGDAAAIAQQAIAAIGLVSPEVETGLSFHDLFQFTPNEMQSRAMTSITAPGVYVIEAPMGMGKTEAALGAAYGLLADKKARGIYFALPTQATSNRMHYRMAEFVRRIAPATVGSRLIHGNSWLLDQELDLSSAATGKQDVTDDARVGRDWFASAKRALLAPFGVGTVDQALLGVVAAKHFFVRRYALARKVVILDEVHSYDVYTGTLIDKLIFVLKELGCTVIVLSATLTGKRRNQIVGSENPSDTAADDPYPLITGRRENDEFEPIPAAPPPSSSVEVVFETHNAAEQQAIAIAESGGCVLWICNTVASAQEQYQRFVAATGERFLLGLLHSRFPFWRRKELEDEWMERLGKSSVARCRSILVSTQIVEQSVDLDADLLVTELAPTDMLLQRIGRLWRHERERRLSPSPRLVILEETVSLDDLRTMNAKAIVTALGGKAWVYDPYVLLRSLQVWNEQQRIQIPTQIRDLIEATYEERENEPKPWIELSCDRYGKATAYKQKALQSSNIWNVALKDDEGVQIRLNEVPTLSLVLCRRLSKTEAEFLDASQADFRGADFRLATAQAIHRNVVRVPDCHFAGSEEHAGIVRYLRGPQQVCLVDSGGTISAEGLKSDLRMSWSNELGVVIENKSARRQL